MLGQLTAQLALPLDVAELNPEPAYLVGSSPCCLNPYCGGCTYSNFLTAEESAAMRAHLSRLLGRQRRRTS